MDFYHEFFQDFRYGSFSYKTNSLPWMYIHHEKVLLFQIKMYFITLSLKERKVVYALIMSNLNDVPPLLLCKSLMYKALPHANRKENLKKARSISVILFALNNFQNKAVSFNTQQKIIKNKNYL